MGEEGTAPLQGARSFFITSPGVETPGYALQ